MIEKYAKENFCLDYSMEYCDNVSEPQFVAVLNDQNLHDNWRNSHATSVFGGGGGDTMLIFKQVGFGISLFFLFLTLAIHFVVPDMRKVCYILRDLLNSYNYFCLGIEWENGYLHCLIHGRCLHLSSHQNFRAGVREPHFKDQS